MSTPAHPQSPFSEVNLSALVAALSQHNGSARDTPTSDDAVRIAVRALCAEARGLQLPPEGLVRALKQLWTSLEEREPAAALRLNGLYHATLGACLEQYFLDAPAPTSTA